MDQGQIRAPKPPKIPRVKSEVKKYTHANTLEKNSSIVTDLSKNNFKRIGISYDAEDK